MKTNQIDVMAILKEMAVDTKPMGHQSLTQIDVTVDPSLVMDSYAKAYLYEMQRLNPEKFNIIKVQLPVTTKTKSGEETTITESPMTEELMQEYFRGVVAIRVESCQVEGCREWRRAKMLSVPSVLETAIAQLGVLRNYDEGYKLVPKCEEKYDMSRLLAISNVIEAFQSDGLYQVKDAFPRSDAGDVDVMSFLIIDGVVKGKKVGQASQLSYISAFLGLKVEDAIAANMFRVPYENVNFIRDSWCQERRLICSQ